MRDQHCGRPSDVYDTDWRTKLTALETISRWLTQKAKKSLFEPPFRALRSNVRTPSMARWKARGRLYIRRDWTFFAISYGWDVMSGNRSKSAFFEGGGSLWAQISEGRGQCPPTTVGVRVAEWLPLRVVSKYLQCRFVTIHACDRRTDGRTNGQNYDSQDRPRICSRGKNELILSPKHRR